MASMVMTASSFPSGAALAAAKPATTTRQGVIVAKASAASEAGNVNLQMKNKEDSSAGRRDLMFGVAAAAALSIAKVAMAEEEPPRGSPEAKKKYAPICVTMPTARICRK